LQGKPTDLVVVVGRACTPEELQSYAKIVSGPDGQAKLAEALGSAYDVGAYRLGTDLGLAVKLITIQPEKHGSRRITLVGTRIPQGLEMQGQLAARDYRFVVIQLRLKQDGSGEGWYYHSAKIRFSPQHLPEVEDYQTQPEAIKNIHPEHSQ
jgi:hypothetical protein